MELLGIELTYEEFDRLMVEQANGKELKVIDGKVVAINHTPTAEELIKKRKGEITARLNKLSQDFIQATAGAQFTDITERIAEFRTLHNELRALEGKEPRVYK